MNILFVFFDDLLLMRGFGNAGKLAKCPSLNFKMLENEQTWGGSIKLPLPSTVPCERENNRVFILSADSVQMCFF